MQGIIGHEHALGIIDAALSGGRIHHAWMFHGPQGVGKFTTAVEMARVLLCHDPQRDLTGRVEACGGCRSCRLFACGDSIEQCPHPDLHLIYKEMTGESEIRKLREKKQSNISIDILRISMIGGDVEGQHFESAIGKRAALDHGKVFIIDGAEFLAHGSNEAQNALLKTLEEPPPNTWLFLITTSEDRLLPTIRSRCQRVPFAALADQAVEQWVAAHPTGSQWSDDQRMWLVRFARGSLGRAELAMEYRLDEWARAIQPLVNRVAGGQSDLAFGPTMDELLKAFAEEWVKRNKNASKDAANKAGVRHMLGLIGEMCRRGLRDAAKAADPDDPIAAEQAAAGWLRGIDLIQRAEKNLLSNVNIGLLLDNLAIQWASGEREPQLVD